MSYICKIPSPLGLLTLSSDGASLTGLWIEGQKYFASTLEADAQERKSPVFERAREWLERYFSGEAPDFTPPLDPKGSKFRQLVWKILLEIPYGEVVTYGDIAKRLQGRVGGSPVSARAVGGAVGHNPISIVIPCHRVIGSNGNLTGYAGGLDNKVKLLRLEKFLESDS